MKVIDKIPYCFTKYYFKTLGAINCVRWSPRGEKLATASNDETAKIFDFASGKVYYTGTMPDERKTYFLSFV